MALGSSRGRRSRRQTFSEINITPFTDVVLVLLIIFMVTAQYIEHSETGKDLNLPSATEVDSLDDLDGIRVRIDRESNLSVDGVPVSFEDLAGELQAVMQSPEQLVILEGDRDTVLQNVVSVMDACAMVGLQVVLATAAEEPLDAEPTAEPTAEPETSLLGAEPVPSGLPFITPTNN